MPPQKNIRSIVLFAVAAVWFAFVYALTYPRILTGLGPSAIVDLPTALRPNRSYVALPVAALLLLASYGLGRQALRRADIPWTKPWQPDLVAPLVGFALLGLVLLVCGAADLLGRFATFGVWVLALFIGRREIRGLLQQRSRAWAALRASIDGAVPVACLVLLAMFGTVGAVVAVAPETTTAALHDHLFAVARYAAAGRFISLPFYEMVHVPELAHVLWIPLWHMLSDVGAKALVFLQAGLMVLLAATVAGELAGRRAAWLAALITAATPAFLSSSTQAAPDIQLALFASFSFWIAVRFGQGSHGALLAGLLVGAAAATKHAGLLLVPVTALLAARSSATAGWRSLAAPAARGSAWRALAGAAVVAGAFYLKNWFAVGNPFYPLLADELGSYRFTPDEVETLLSTTTHSGPGRDLSYFLGALLLSGAALIPVTLGDRTARGLVIALLLFLVAFALGRHDVRWFLPAVPLLAALIASAVEQLRERDRIGRIAQGAFVGIVLGTAVLHLPFFSSAWLRASFPYEPRHMPLNVVMGGESRSDYLSRRLPGYAIAENYNVRNPEFRLLALPEWDPGLPPVWLGSALVRNNVAVRIWRAALAAGNPDSIYETLRANKITHIVVRQDVHDKRVALISEHSPFGQRHLKPLDTSGPYVLFVLKRTTSAPLVGDM